MSFTFTKGLKAEGAKEETGGKRKESVKDRKSKSYSEEELVAFELAFADEKVRKEGETMLIRASSEGRLGMVQLLLRRRNLNNVNQHKTSSEKNAVVGDETLNIEARMGKSRITALYSAAREGHEDVVIALLDAGADLNSRSSNGATPLIAACQRGRRGVVTILLERGADINTMTDDGRTCLYIASSKNDVNMLSLLLQRGGVNINAKTRGGDTAFNVALIHGYLDSILLLLRQPALNFYAGIPNSKMAKRKDVEALYLQTFSSERPITSKALQSARNKLQVAFHEHAAKTESIFALLETRNLAAVRMLLNLRPQEVSARSDVDSMTPLIFSSYMGYVGAVKVLLQQKEIDINAQEENGATALYAASQQGYESVVLALLERGASLNIARYDGDLPLTVACQHGNMEALKVLRERGGADINTWTQGRQTNCLISACLHGHYDVASLALSWGADINAASDSLLTPLISACGKGHIDIALMLLQHPSLKQDDIQSIWGGMSPAQLCEQKLGSFAQPRLSQQKISRALHQIRNLTKGTNFMDLNPAQNDTHFLPYTFFAFSWLMGAQLKSSLSGLLNVNFNVSSLSISSPSSICVLFCIFVSTMMILCTIYITRALLRTTLFSKAKTKSSIIKQANDMKKIQ